MSEIEAKTVHLVSAVEALIGFVQETISSPAAKRFDDYYAPRLRGAVEALDYALNVAYADGRADEAAERAPVTAALRELVRLKHLEDRVAKSLASTGGPIFERHREQMHAAWKAAQDAIRATEVTEPVPAKEET